MLRRNPGILYALAAYGIWGLLPAYLKLLRPMPAADILAHRILWSLLLLAAIAAAIRRGPVLGAILRRGRLIATLTLSAALIGVNWLIYIWAVNSGHIADASLGYFINPLANVLLGMVVLRERLGRAELVAVLVALAGVLWLTYAQGRLPLTSLALAASFSLYGLVRKIAPVEALDGLLIETGLLAPFALGWLALAGAPLTAASPGWPLIVPSALVTALPLLLFTAAAKRGALCRPWVAAISGAVAAARAGGVRLWRAAAAPAPGRVRADLAGASRLRDRRGPARTQRRAG